MAAILRLTSFMNRKSILQFPVRRFCKVTMGDPLDHATGIEKRELLAQMAGNDDPWDMQPMKRGPGTKEEPNEIPSAFDSRIVGCTCVPDANSVSYMMLYKGQPKRCECGFWFTLVHKTPV